MFKLNTLPLFFCIGIGGLALADQSPAPRDSSPECHQIVTACGEAGFSRGLPQGVGRDLDKGCFQPILQGQKIAGVTVDQNTVKSCMEQQQARPRVKKKRRNATVG